MNKHLPKILFVDDKWSGSIKERGRSAWEVSMEGSLECTGLASYDLFHFDDYFFTTGKKGDQALLDKIAEYKPDIIFLITNKLPGSRFNVLDFSTLEKIKHDLKIPIVGMWSDLGWCYGKLETNQVEISKTILPYAEFHVSTMSTAVLSRIGRPDKYIHMWIPKDQRIFNNPNKKRDIEIGYVGSPRKNRLSLVSHLVKNGIKVVHGGGEGNDHFTLEQFTDRYQRSKIVLNFSRVRSSHAILCRLVEAMTCGAMVLEQESLETMKFYIPYVDYVPYNGKRDMLRKAKYYLAHDEERERIARSGQEKTERLYSSMRFWQIVINRALGVTTAEAYKFDYTFPQESLANLPRLAAFRMRFLNTLCATPVGFLIYRIFNRHYWQETIQELWHSYFITPIGKIKPILEKHTPKKIFELILKMKRKFI